MTDLFVSVLVDAMPAELVDRHVVELGEFVAALRASDLERLDVVAELQREALRRWAANDRSYPLWVASMWTQMVNAEVRGIDVQASVR